MGEKGPHRVGKFHGLFPAHSGAYMVRITVLPGEVHRPTNWSEDLGQDSGLLGDLARKRPAASPISLAISLHGSPVS